LRHDADRLIALTSAWVAFACCSVLPIVWMLGASVGTARGVAVVGALSDHRQRVLIAQTLLLAAGTAACAMCAGAPLGIALARCDPFRVRIARLALAAPLVFPSYVLALAWVALTDHRVPEWSYGLAGAIAVLAFSLYPIVMLAVEASMRSVPAHLEEAALLVAGSRRVWSKVVLPLIAPSLVASTLVVFVLALSEFAVPSMLRVRVYTTEVFTAFSALYDFRGASLMALPLGVVAGVASVVALQISRRSLVARTERGPIGARWSSRRQQRASLLLGLLALGAIALPVGVMTAEAREGRTVFFDARSIQAAGSGIVWSAIAATVVVLIGALLGYWRTKAPPAAARVADGLWIALFALPATVVGIGTIGIWNRSGMLGDAYRTEGIVVVAYVSRFLPIGALLCAAFLQRLTPAAEEAAIVSGASWTRALTRVVLPIASRGLAAVWLVVFILMMADVSLTILVAPPGESNLPVRAYTLIANSPVGDVARIALIQLALSVLPLFGMLLIVRRRGPLR
jgi:iron(III) transport system permease protein